MEAYWCQQIRAMHPEVPMDARLFSNNVRGTQLVSDISEDHMETHPPRESLMTSKGQDSANSHCCDLTSHRPENLSLSSSVSIDSHSKVNTDLSLKHIADSSKEKCVSEYRPHRCGSPECLGRNLSHMLSSTLDVASAAETFSELFIVESDAEELLQSSQNPKYCLQQIRCPENLSSSHMDELDVNSDHDTHVPRCDSTDEVTQSHHIFTGDGDGDSESVLRPPAVEACASMPVNCARGQKPSSDSAASKAGRGDSPDELWLDACQYLTAEDTRNVLCRTGHSVTNGGPPVTPSSPFRDIKVFGYNSGDCSGIGCFGADAEGWRPPVERWSSVDSWASALSDWWVDIPPQPEDFTAAFTEIGAEIDALTQALTEAEAIPASHTKKEPEIVFKGEGQERTRVQTLMAIQDQVLQEQSTPESSVHSEPQCPSETAGLFASSEPNTTSKVSTANLPGEGEPEEEKPEVQRNQAARPPSSAFHGLVVGVSCPTLNPEPTMATVLNETVTYLHHSDGCDDTSVSEIYISHADAPVVLNIVEDMDFETENLPAQLFIEEAYGEDAYEVTERLRSVHLDPLAEQEHRRSRDSRLAILKCPSSKAETSTVQFEDSNEIESAKGPHLPDILALKDSHVPGVNTQSDLHTSPSSDTSQGLDRACQVESQWGGPQFIMPVAPLSTSSSLTCGTRNILDWDHILAKGLLNENSDHCSNHVQFQAPCPPLDGINELSLDDKRGNITDCLETSPAENVGLLDKCLFISNLSRSDPLSTSVDICSNFSCLGNDPERHFFVSQEDHIACITLDLYDPFVSGSAKSIVVPPPFDYTAERIKFTQMPHKSHKSSDCNKARSKKDKSSTHHQGAQESKKKENSCDDVPAGQCCRIQETQPHTEKNSQGALVELSDKDVKLVTITDYVATDRVSTKTHSKKKKKPNQTVETIKGGSETLSEIKNGAKPKTTKGRNDIFEANVGATDGNAQNDINQIDAAKNTPQKPEDKTLHGEQTLHHGHQKDHKPSVATSSQKDDVSKRRRLSDTKFGKIVKSLESKLEKTEDSVQAKGEDPQAEVGSTCRKAYDEVPSTIVPKEGPKVVQPIQATAVSGDPQSLCLWCQFAANLTSYTATWSREGTVQEEITRSAGDERRVSLIIPNASHKDLGKYQCRLSSLHGSVTLEYLLTYEVLSEIVIPASQRHMSSVPSEVVCEEEDVNCSRLMFRGDFLSDQYFEDGCPLSIVTEKVHFGEGMHRKAFRTKLQTVLKPLSMPGHSCVLKVHNAISYGTNNNDDLIKKNFSLAVEECQVQNTAREYIKAYTLVAQSVEAFGEVPEIIPIYLVHRPSNDIPYATLEEELIGDFVKYSVRDGKEINLMRKDSEAGQKCCAFQHWVYQSTEGNLLVTDMQGVGMKLTDVGIATGKKGYKGFKGNCATTFIDQFKALHQCNKYCEILGLQSLQPKPKKPAPPLKGKPQPSSASKKKTFGPTLKDKS